MNILKKLDELLLPNPHRKEAMEDNITEAEVVDQAQKSPVIEKDKEVAPMFSFTQALEHVKAGKRITKDEWQDPEIYGLLDGGEVRLHMSDGKTYQWIISEGDLVGEDWIVLA